jgi:hypothetical protein
MEKAMYLSPYIRITQKHGIGTHIDSYAFDEAGSDGGIDYLIAPFTGTIKKIYTSDANEVWLESNGKVKYADDTEDYMTIMLAHDNDVSNLKVGQVIKQGQRFYEEGTKGQATGNHVHIECAKGKFTGTGWHKNSAGYWSINNGKKVDECLWIDDSYKIMNTAGYKFRNVKDAEPKKLGTPVKRNEKIDQVRIYDESVQVRARKTPNGDVLGYMNTGIYNLLERKSDGDYEWFRVENNLWFANSKDWCEVLSKKEEPKPVVDEDKVKIEELQKEIDSLKETIKLQDAEILELKNQLENQPKLIFTCTQTNDYQIKLYENERLYIREQ